MSASEKLKALDAQGHRLYLNGVDADIAPQIVAVVEAAEETHARARGYSEVPISDLREIELILERALDALDEALT